MHSAGFSNFPGEWWHFSYGDRVWAAYLRKTHAILRPDRYGKAEEHVSDAPALASDFI